MEKNVATFDEDFIKNYDENSDKGYIIEVDVEYPQKLLNLHSDWLFLAERMKIKKCNILRCNLYDKKEYVVHIRTLKQPLNHRLILKKYIEKHKFNLSKKHDWNHILKWILNWKQKQKMILRNIFLKLMNNSGFEKTMENVRKQRDIKLITTYKRRNQSVLELTYHKTKYFSKDVLAIEMKKVKVEMNKPIYLGFSIFDIIKTLLYEFWYDYVKQKYQNNAKICYMDTGSFVVHIKTEDFYEDIANDFYEDIANGLIHQIMKLIDRYLKE